HLPRQRSKPECNVPGDFKTVLRNYHSLPEVIAACSQRVKVKARPAKLEVLTPPVAVCGCAIYSHKVSARLILVQGSGLEGGFAMFRRTRVISLAAIAALFLSGPASAMAAASDHPKKKITHAAKPIPKSASKRTAPGSAPAKYPSPGPY